MLVENIVSVLVSYAAVLRIVTQRREERCVTTLRTVAQETISVFDVDNFDCTLQGF